MFLYLCETVIKYYTSRPVQSGRTYYQPFEQQDLSPANENTEIGVAVIETSQNFVASTTGCQERKNTSTETTLKAVDNWQLQTGLRRSLVDPALTSDRRPDHLSCRGPTAARRATRMYLRVSECYYKWKHSWDPLSGPPTSAISPLSHYTLDLQTQKHRAEFPPSRSLTHVCSFFLFLTCPIITSESDKNRP